MLGIIAAIIGGFKGRTWFAVLSGMYSVLVIFDLAETGGNDLSIFTTGWLLLIISLCLSEKKPEKQVIIVKEKSAPKPAPVKEPAAIKAPVADNSCELTYRYCYECGSRTIAGAKFCQSCGTKLD